MAHNTNNGIRLNSTGTTTSNRFLPDSFIEAVSSVFSDEDDIYAVLATYSYVFCGTRINDLCDMFLIAGKTGIKRASREFVRHRIVSTFIKIRDAYHTSYASVAPMYLSDEDNLFGFVVSDSDQENTPSTEDVSQYGSEEVQIPAAEARETRRRPCRSDFGDCHVDRPGYQILRVGSVRDNT